MGLERGHHLISVTFDVIKISISISFVKQRIMQGCSLLGDTTISYQLLSAHKIDGKYNII